MCIYGRPTGVCQGPAPGHLPQEYASLPSKSQSAQRSVSLTFREATLLLKREKPDVCLRSYLFKKNLNTHINNNISQELASSRYLWTVMLMWPWRSSSPTYIYSQYAKEEKVGDMKLGPSSYALGISDKGGSLNGSRGPCMLVLETAGSVFVSYVRSSQLFSQSR